MGDGSKNNLLAPFRGFDLLRANRLSARFNGQLALTALANMRS